MAERPLSHAAGRDPDATTVPEISSGNKASCDEFAYASTCNSGGMLSLIRRSVR